MQQSVSRVGGACSHPFSDPCSVCVCVWCVYCLIDDLTSVFLINLSKKLIRTPYWPLGVLQKNQTKHQQLCHAMWAKPPFIGSIRRKLCPPPLPLAYPQWLAPWASLALLASHGASWPAEVLMVVLVVNWRMVVQNRK